MYCPKCKKLVDGLKCPECKKPTREPMENDICFLTEKQTMMAEMLKDVLDQNAIPCLLIGVLGAGLSAMLGEYIEYSKVYVNYSDYDKALQLVDELFGAPVYDSNTIETTDDEEESIETDNEDI